MSNIQFEYDIFLSHNSKDKPMVKVLATRLEDEYGLKVFLDLWNLVPGDPWQEELEDAMDKSRTVAVFLGPSGIGGWHNEEMRNALDQRVRDPERRVIPVLLPGTSKPQTDTLPPFLTRLTWVKFTSLDDEEAFNRLVAGIKGQQPGRGTTPPGEDLPVSLPEEETPPKEPSEKSSGPTFHGSFKGTFVGRDQTNIKKYEDRSVNVNAPITGSTIVTGDKNVVRISSEVTLEEFTDLLEKMSELIPQVPLETEEREAIQGELDQVQAEAAKPEPSRDTILKRLGNMVELMANSATIATAAPILLEMGQQAIDWASTLF